ncbi:MAG: hypothetical protein H0T95_08990 [Chthoniobacterales bacterium]|nr:hypothetical protein [Chthoniobacterales bacterium]
MKAPVFRRYLRTGSIVAALCNLATSHARADAVSELASFSVFNNVDLAQLAKGEAKTQRGVPMSNPRFLSVQSCWVAPGSPEQVSSALRNWSPSGHPEMKVFIHANGSDFSRLKDAPGNGAVRSLVDATQKLSPELQVSKDEASRFSAAGAESGGGMPPAVINFWTTILSARSRAFASGGSSAQAPYDHTGQNIRPGDELSGMLNGQAKIRKQFAPLLENSGIGRGGSGKADQFWELLEVDKKGVLTLGASYNRAGGAASQTADVLYYASGGFYAALTFHQMWPVNLEGKPATLVWRGDIISSAELSGLAGVERLGSESAMMKDVARSIRVFRRDTGK